MLAFYEPARVTRAGTQGVCMEIGVFIPIGNNGWLISSTAPQYLPTFDLNKDDIPCGPILSMKEIAEEPSLRATARGPYQRSP